MRAFALDTIKPGVSNDKMTLQTGFNEEKTKNLDIYLKSWQLEITGVFWNYKSYGSNTFPEFQYLKEDIGSKK